jgi:hypothetical protein
MCPYYLDGDRTRNGSVIPVVDAIAIARDRCGYCAVFKDRRRRTLAVGRRPDRGMRDGHPARAGLSKLNSMPGSPTPHLKRSAVAGGGPVRFGRRARPDGRSRGPGWAVGSAGAPYGAP